MKISRCFGIILTSIFLPTIAIIAAPRLIITTDIGGDPDDMQSLVRLLVFSNEFEIEAMIASASGTPNELKEAVTRPDLIRKFVKAYAEVFPKLKQYASGYPDPAALESRIFSGNRMRGWGSVGETHDTPGSEAILAAILRDDPRPLNIAIWGGQTDVAQALWKLKQTQTETTYFDALERVRIYDIADQDGIFENIHRDHPTLFYVLNRAQPGADKREAVFRGMYLGGDESLTSKDWIDANVRQHHGALGSLYPTKTWTAPNPHGVMKEGDTPSWFYFLNNGMQNPAQPSWGGWGGRFQKHPDGGYYVDAVDTMNNESIARLTVWRWRQDFQNAFAARMDACVRGAKANHAPVIEPDARTTRKLVSGESTVIDLCSSFDPDGNSLRINAFLYQEPGTPGVNPLLHLKENLKIECEVPSNSPTGEAHLIVSLVDDGEPTLTSYRRYIIKVVNP